MNRTVVNVDQRTPEWHQARCGRLTGTYADGMLAEGRKKGEPSIQRRDLRLRLAIERITGVPLEEDFKGNRHTEYGNERELDGLHAYEAYTGVLVRQTGFIQRNDLLVGCSLDGDIDDFTGIVEIKCPKTTTHYGYLLNPEEIPLDYLRQITHNVWVTGAEWCDFVSFDDRFPTLSLMVRRVYRAELDLTAYELAARLFLSEVEKEVAAIRRLIDHRAVA